MLFQIKENAFEDVWNMSVIMLREQCVKRGSKVDYEMVIAYVLFCFDEAYRCNFM